jgi:PEP-CTERM motif
MGADMIITPKLKVSGLAVIALLGMVLTSGAAFAIPVSGTSSGSFANPSCNFAATCTVSGSGNSVYTFGDSAFGFSTATAAQNFAFGGATPFTAPVGSITWTNNFDPVAVLGQNFGIDYALAIVLTLPPGAGGVAGPLTFVETLQLLGLAPDTASLPNISGNVITVQHSAGTLTIDNFQYSGTGVSGLTWTNPECLVNPNQCTRTLTISAHFNNVPEPATLALVGAGLMGLGCAMRRRRKARA